MTIPFVLSAGVEGLLGVVVLTLTILGYIVDAIKKNRDNNQTERPTRRAPKKNTLEEIYTIDDQRAREEREKLRTNKPAPDVIPSNQKQKSRRQQRKNQAQTQPTSLAKTLTSAIESPLNKPLESSEPESSKPLTHKDLAAAAAIVHPKHPLTQAMTDPAAIRQAIILQEILGRPKALQN